MLFLKVNVINGSNGNRYTRYYLLVRTRRNAIKNLRQHPAHYKQAYNIVFITDTVKTMLYAYRLDGFI